jgi:hypothetical protein
MPVAEYERSIESWIGRTVTGAKLSRISPHDDAASGVFTLETAFTAPRYGQLMQNRLLIFKPAIVSRRASLFLTDAYRKYPVQLSSQAYTETVRIQLPPGFEVDELPDAVELETTFGSYTARHTLENGSLVFTRRLTVRRSLLPVEQYAVVRGFYERILALEQAPAVLIRK